MGEIKEGYLNSADWQSFNKQPSLYFTPNIEDIRVGNEYEFLHGVGMENQKLWKPIKVEKGNIHIVLRDVALIRGAYLTKEQLEKEGWVFKNLAGDLETYKYITNTSYELELSRWRSKPTARVGIAGYDEWGTPWQQYHGSCRDINELRIIIKLLGIV